MKTKNQRRKRQDISTSGGNKFGKTRSFRKLSANRAISQHKLKSTLNRNLKTLIPSENSRLTITKFFVEKVPKFIFRFTRIKFICFSSNTLFTLVITQLGIHPLDTDGRYTRSQSLERSHSRSGKRERKTYRISNRRFMYFTNIRMTKGLEIASGGLKQKLY